MITPAPILNKYRSVEPYLEPLRAKVRDSLLVLCDREGFALVSRIKALESVCEKVETGRFRSWSGIDDLVAFAVVVPKLSDEARVLEFLRGTFEEVSLRLRGSTQKPPDAFRFDATRFIGLLSVIGEDPRPPMLQIPFEIQIRSAFEHAWSVATHSLSYKSPDISWSKLRLAAQLKAAVEQLDTLVASFEAAKAQIDEGVWPEIQAKANLREFFAARVESGAIPGELAPKDWSRFIDNVYAAAAAAATRRRRPHEINQLVQRDLDAELVALGAGAVPLSISLWQLTFASLVKSGTAEDAPPDRWPLITPELEELYPLLRGRAPRFDYS